MASDMKPHGGKKADMASHGLENSGVPDQDWHDNSSLVESHTEVKSSIEICGVCSFDCDHADDLVEEVRGSKSRSSHVETADHDNCLDVQKESCLAADNLPQESEIEQAGGTLEDLFFFNEEEEDDGDWEPTTRLAVNRWFCLNCTMPNIDEITYCLNCHQLKGSDVAGYDVFKTQIAQTALLSADTDLPTPNDADLQNIKICLHQMMQTCRIVIVFLFHYLN